MRAVMLGGPHDGHIMDLPEHPVCEIHMPQVTQAQLTMPVTAQRDVYMPIDTYTATARLDHAGRRIYRWTGIR